MNARTPPPSPPILPCWINGYRSLTGGTWHGDPMPSLAEAIERAAYVTKAGRSRIIYRVHAKAHPSAVSPVVEVPAGPLPAAVAQFVEQACQAVNEVYDRPALVTAIDTRASDVDVAVANTLSAAMEAPQGGNPAPAAPIPAPAPEPAPAPAPAQASHTRHPDLVRNTRKAGQTQKDRIIDAYAATGDNAVILANRLEIVRATVTSTLAAGRVALDPRVLAGDRKGAARLLAGTKAYSAGQGATAKDAATAEAQARAGTVIASEHDLPPGKVCLASAAAGTVVGRYGTWQCAARTAAALAFMADGQMYGPLVLARAGYPRSTNYEETIRSWRTKLAAIGVKLVETPKVGFRLETMEKRP